MSVTVVGVLHVNRLILSDFPQQLRQKRSMSIFLSFSRIPIERHYADEVSSSWPSLETCRRYFKTSLTSIEKKKVQSDLNSVDEL